MRSFLGLLLLISGFVVSSLPSRANLGDTLSQCITRYGQPTSHGRGLKKGSLEWYAFKRGTLENGESFSGGIVVLEVFWKHVGGDVNAPFQGISKSEREAILQEESTIGRWSKPEMKNDSISWVRTVDGAMAEYRNPLMTLRARAQKT